MIPRRIIAGDSTQLTYSNEQYPSSAWTLTVFLTGPSSLELTGTAQPDESFLVAFSAAQTAPLKEGVHDLTLRVSHTDGTVKTVSTSIVDIQPNPVLKGSKMALAAEMIALIDAALKNQIIDGMSADATSANGQNIQFMSRPDLLIERAYWARELNRVRQVKNNGIKMIDIDTGKWS